MTTSVAMVLPERLLPREVAQLCGVTSDTVAAWCQTGRCPPLTGHIRTPGGRYLVLRAWVQQYLTDRLERADPASPGPARRRGEAP